MAITTAPAVPSLRRDGEETSDQDLVARVRAGDDVAFERLYRRYHRRIAAYIQGMVHDHARAEDVTQDVFMSALRRMRETERPIAFKPWIYEIAKNACIDQFRRSRRAEEVSYDAEDGGLASADYGKLVTKDPQPDVAVENKQSLDHLRGAFGGLSETHHEILVMRELEGLSYREIGERLGMTRPAVESTLFRARRRLTEEYEQLVTGERCQRVQGIIATASTGALGARDRRRLARHVSYCQPCMRHARMSGIDSADLVHTPLRAKIAGLLPLPAFLKQKLAGDAGSSPDMSSLALWSSHASTVDPGIMSSWGKAAATAATIAIAGVGANVATTPSGDARASLDGRALLERLTGGDEASEGGGVAARPRTPSGTASGGATASPPRVTGGGRRSTSRDADRRRGDSGSRERSGSDSGSSGSGDATGTGGSGIAAAPTAATGTGDTSATDRAADPVRDTLDRLTGDGGDSSSGDDTTTDDGSGGVLPSLLPGPSSGTQQPQGEVPTGSSTPQDPVGEVVGGPGKSVDDAVGTVTDTVGVVVGGQ